MYILGPLFPNQGVFFMRVRFDGRYAVYLQPSTFLRASTV